MKRGPQFSSGYELARNRMITMPDDELTALTAERLIASYGLRPTEASQLIRAFQRRT